ncbi:MAG: hypothetical protein AABW99_04670, partial [archaeon]
VLSLNRQPFDGELVDLRAGQKTVSLTPEHEVYTAFGDKEAGKVSRFDRLISLVKLEVAKVLN